MARIAWLTDIHLNFVPLLEIAAFAAQIRAQFPDAILISGDIGEAPSLVAYLRLLDELLPMPMYFVLGNHDFYGGSIEAVRAQVTALSQEGHFLRWLSAGGVVELAPNTALIGHDGWADGRLGDFANSDVLLSDYVVIDELKRLPLDELLTRLNRLGDEAAAYFREWLPLACKSHRNVIVLTHVPPFRDACWYDGEISDDNFLPHFASLSTGEALRAVMEAHPDNQCTVLCGHTHGGGEVQILPNLRVLTGSAEYGICKIESVFEVH